MTLYYRKPDPTRIITMDRPIFGHLFRQFLDLLQRAGQDARPIGEAYHFVEDVVVHYLAFNTLTDQLVGTLQVNRDDKGMIHLHRLLVDPEYHAVGIASELIARAMDQFENEFLVTEITANENPAILRMLEAYDFQTDEGKQNDGEDEAGTHNAVVEGSAGEFVGDHGQGAEDGVGDPERPAVDVPSEPDSRGQDNKDDRGAADGGRRPRRRRRKRPTRAASEAGRGAVEAGKEDQADEGEVT